MKRAQSADGVAAYFTIDQNAKWGAIVFLLWWLTLFVSCSVPEQKGTNKDQVLRNSAEPRGDQVNSDLTAPKKDTVFECNGTALTSIVYDLAHFYKVRVYNPYRVSGSALTGSFWTRAGLQQNVSLLSDVEKWNAVVYLQNDTIFLAPFKQARNRH